MSSELFAKYQFGRITHSGLLQTVKVTNRALCSVESEIFRRLYQPHISLYYAVSVYFLRRLKELAVSSNGRHTHVKMIGLY